MESSLPEQTLVDALGWHGFNIPLVALPRTTSATSDSVTLTGMTSSGHCLALTPTNAGAATNIATSYISAKAANQITVTHTATAGKTYDVLHAQLKEEDSLCSQNQPESERIP